MNAWYKGEEKNYPAFFSRGDSLKLGTADEKMAYCVAGPESTDPLLAIAIGHIVQYDIRDLHNAGIDWSRNAIDRLIPGYRRQTDSQQAEDGPFQKIVIADPKYGEKFCQLDYKSDAIGNLYICSRLPEVEDVQRQGAVAAYSILKMVEECGTEEGSCIIKCDNDSFYHGLLNLVGRPKEDYTFLETLNLARLRRCGYTAASELGRELLDFLGYRRIDPDGILEVTDALRLTNRLRKRNGQKRFLAPLLKDYLNMEEIFLDEELQKGGYRLVFPEEDEDTWKAFDGLLPRRFDYREKKRQIVGITNENGYPVAAMAITIVADDGYHIHWLQVAHEERGKGTDSQLVQALTHFIGRSANAGKIDAGKIDAQSHKNGELRALFDALHHFDTKGRKPEFTVDEKEKIERRILKTRLENI